MKKFSKKLSFVLLVFVAFFGVLAVSQYAEEAVEADQSCVPAWKKDFAAEVNRSSDFAGESKAMIAPVNYVSLTTAWPTSNVFCTYFDTGDQVTKVFSGDYSNDWIYVANIQPDLIGYSTIVNLSYGLTWLIEDLDGDGNRELVMQRGDGVHGYLDIYSEPTLTPNWTLRASILLPFQNVYFHPVAVNLDTDNHLELFLTPSSLGGNEHAVVVQYNQFTNTFEITDNLAGPSGLYGPAAAYDFDNDGYVEIVVGVNGGYGLYEYVYVQEPSLRYIGVIPGTNSGNWATTLRPKPVRSTYLMTGSTMVGNGYTYQLWRPNGTVNNSFVLVQTFNEDNGYFGIHPCFVMDDDNDGLDEFGMNFYPYFRMYEWNSVTAQFENIYTWDQLHEGTFRRFAPTDLDRDHRKEWAIINHFDDLHFWERYDTVILSNPIE